MHTRFWHSSDLDPRKPIHWNRQAATDGAYGYMGDLGMHVLHPTPRLGWVLKSGCAPPSEVVPERPEASGAIVPCDIWDNAMLACEVETGGTTFPMLPSTRRIAPGHANTWFPRVTGTALSAEFNTRHPKPVATRPYTPGESQVYL